MQNCQCWRGWSVLASLPSVIKNDHHYFSWICLAWNFRYWIFLHLHQPLLNERVFILYNFCLHRFCIHAASLLFKDKQHHKMHMKPCWTTHYQVSQRTKSGPSKTSEFLLRYRPVFFWKCKVAWEEWKYFSPKIQRALQRDYWWNPTHD